MRARGRRGVPSGPAHARPTLKSTLFGGYDKLDVLEYIEQLLDRMAAEKQALDKQIAAAQSVIDTLKAENASLKDSLSYYQEQCAAADRKADQLATLLLEAEKMKRRQLKEVQAERDRVLAQARRDAARLSLEQSNEVKAQAQRDMQELLEEFARFTQASAADTYQIFEELTSSLEQVEQNGGDTAWQSKKPTGS